jgi:hypothetical protein
VPSRSLSARCKIWHARSTGPLLDRKADDASGVIGDSLAQSGGVAAVMEATAPDAKEPVGIDAQPSM